MILVGFMVGLFGIILLKLTGLLVADIYIFDVAIMAINLGMVLDGFGLGNKATVVISIAAGFVMFYLVHICEPVEYIAAFFFSWLWAVDLGSMVSSSSWKGSLIIFVVSMVLHFAGMRSIGDNSNGEDREERKRCQD